MQFKKAERIQASLKLAITGPSGSGKTYSALSMASGIALENGSRVAVIDTENGSASLYSDKFDFDVLEIQPPYTIDKYTSAIKAAVEGGYQVLVIDSISHAWAGEGGLLDKKADIDARGKGNSYTNWATVTKEHEAFKSQILYSDIHIIVTMRSKMEYAITEEGGKKEIKKMGLAPVQRDGIEYEFTTVFDVAMDHKAAASKDRTGLFADKIFTISQETGKGIMSWLKGGKVPDPKPAPKPEQKTAPQSPLDTMPDDISAKFREKGGWTRGDVARLISYNNGDWKKVDGMCEFFHWDKSMILDAIKQEATA